MTAGISAKLSGGMRGAPAMPGIAASWRITSMQSFLPSA
jgi:hypothetical protein